MAIFYNATIKDYTFNTVEVDDEQVLERAAEIRRNHIARAEASWREAKKTFQRARKPFDDGTASREG